MRPVRASQSAASTASCRSSSRRRGANATASTAPATRRRAILAAFGAAGRIVASQTVDTTTSSEYVTLTRVFEFTPAGGWEQLPIVLAAEPGAHAIAVGPGTTTALATVTAAQRTVVWTRTANVFEQDFLGSDGQPAPPDPVTSIVSTDDATIGALWTAAVDATPGAPVRLLGALRRQDGVWQPELVLDGPFPADPAPVQLRTFALPQHQAIAVWSRAGRIRCALLH
jgi:hypothetical protein